MKHKQEIESTSVTASKKLLGIMLTENTSRWNVVGTMMIVFTAMLAIMLTVTVLQDFLLSYCHIKEDVISKTVGILMASYNLTYFLSAPLWGRLSDKIGRRQVAVLCFVIGAIALSSVGLMRSFWQIFAAKIFVGIGLAGGMSMAMAAAADYCQMRERGKIMGLFGTLIGIAAVLGIPMGAIMYSINYYAPFLLQGLLYTTCAILAFFLLKPGLAIKRSGAHPHSTASFSSQPTKKKNLFLKLLTIPRLRFVCIVAFFLGGGQQMDMVVFLPWGRYIAGIEREVLGQYLGVSAILFTVFVIIAGYMSKKTGSLQLILWGISGIFICYLIAALVSNIPIIIIAYLSIAVFKAFAYPSGLALAASSSAMEHRGSSMGLYHSFRSVGEICFSLTIGVLFSFFSQSLGAQYALLGGFIVPMLVAIIVIIYNIKIISDEKKQAFNKEK